MRALDLIEVFILLLFSFVLVQCTSSPTNSGGDRSIFFISLEGSDSSGNGSEDNPWRTIDHAMEKIPSEGGVEVVLKSGTYNGTILIERGFDSEVILRSEEPYGAMLTNVSDNFSPILFVNYEGSMNLVIRDLVFSNEGTTQGPCTNRYGLMIHFSNVIDITFEGNIVYGNNRMPRCNEMFKVNIVGTSTFPRGILIKGNIFGNPAEVDGNDLIDVFEPGEIDILENIFYSDRGGSSGNAFIRLWGEWGSNDTKDPRYNISRNIFLRHEGNSEDGYIAFGGENTGIFEVTNALIENNLILGDSSAEVLAPFVFRGVSGITLRANTVLGNLPSGSFGLDVGADSSNPPSEDVFIRGNIWSDPNSSMSPFLKKTGSADLSSFLLKRNLFWNGGAALPSGSDVDPDDDATLIAEDPLLPAVSGELIFPTWDSSGGKFSSGSLTIREEFERLVEAYAAIPENSPAKDAADINQMPDVDILGRKRDSSPDIGAFEFGGLEE